jgi:hypothetical protein
VCVCVCVCVCVTHPTQALPEWANESTTYSPDVVSEDFEASNVHYAYWICAALLTPIGLWYMQLACTAPKGPCMHACMQCGRVHGVLTVAQQVATQ